MHRYQFFQTLILACCATFGAKAAEVDQIRVRGKIVHVGQTADTFFSIVKPSDVTNQTVGEDPGVRNSLRVSKNVEVEGKQFAVTLVRQNYSGPYVIESIDVLSPGLDSQAPTKPGRARKAVKAVVHAPAANVSPMPVVTGTVAPTGPTFK